MSNSLYFCDTFTFSEVAALKQQTKNKCAKYPENYAARDTDLRIFILRSLSVKYMCLEPQASQFNKERRGLLFEGKEL